MKTPSFWYMAPTAMSLPALALAPLAGLYDSIASRHRDRSDARVVPLPVICVGNFVAGGSGKTPTAIALLKVLKERNVFLAPGFLTRGYRGKINKPERVDMGHDPAMWGDEALLLNRHAPTFVARKRYDGALLMQQQGCDAVIMDDGLQHYGLAKDVSLAVVDGTMGFGNGRTMPAGPLRQSLADGCALADAFILIGDDHRSIRASLPADKPMFRAQLQVRTDFTLDKTTPYVAFCGIGYPDKFKTTLTQNGANLVGWQTYADHHAYSMPDIYKLIGEATLKGARLITTEKDYARLPDFQQKALIDILPVEITFAEPGQLADFVNAKTEAKRRA